MSNRLPLLALLLTPQVVPAEEAVQLSAHVHGLTELQIALEKDAMEIALHSPAFNLIGYEHQPQNERQREQLSNTLSLLKQPDKFLFLTPEAGCRPVHVQVETTLGEEADAQGGGHAHTGEGDSHEEDSAHAQHEHEHEHEGEAHEHADFQAVYHYRCEYPHKLTALDADLFSHFPLIEEVDALIVTPELQRETELTPGTTRIPLSSE